MSTDQCIIVFPHSVRVFQNPNQAEKFYARQTIEKYLIRSQKHFDELYDYIQAEVIKNIEKQFGPIDYNKAASQIWELATKHGDKVRTLAPGRSTIFDDKESYKHHASMLIDNKQTFEWYPKQARIILETIVRSLPERFIEDDIRQLVTNLVVTGKLKTKQDPYYIFQYYRPRYIEDGFLTRGAS